MIAFLSHHEGALLAFALGMCIGMIVAIVLNMIDTAIMARSLAESRKVKP